MEAVLDGARATGIRTLSLGSSEMGCPLYASLGFLSSDTEMVRVEPA